ncbi:MAG: SMC-Scp complex subunit ScpB [Candidatus Margulisbacteria bacterium]|nr:SMC-Scp complex subunit ScpB [Candidatus Margulisiibacteriota bacterium]
MLDILKNKIETILFIAKTPLTIEEITNVLKEDVQQIEEALIKLKEEYASRALQIMQIAGGYQIATRAEYHEIVEKYAKSPIEVSLSAAAMETLAIIAYRQPISRREIETIRGVNSDAVVKSLVEKRLVAELGKSEALGKPVVYGTTDFFLKHFGLNDLKDLPPDIGMKYQLPLKNEEKQEEKKEEVQEVEVQEK